MSDGRRIVEELPFIQLLSPAVGKLVVDSFTSTSYEFGETIVREGEPADAFFVLTAGRARVVKDGSSGVEVVLNSLRPGEFFGELALFDDDSRRTATVRASSRVEALRLDRSVFQALVRACPDGARYLVIHARNRRLHNFLRLNSAFRSLPPDALGDILRALEPVEVPAGEPVIRQGEPGGPMYVVENGHLRVYVDEDGQRRYLAYLRQGDYFGELSLLSGAPRLATVEAVGPCQLLRLSPADFDAILDRSPEFRDRIEQQVKLYDYQREARVPLDFAQEILPAEAAAHEKVGPAQIDDELDGTADGACEEDRPAPGMAGGQRRKRRIRRIPFIRQIDAMDCGAAALAMVCRHFGRSISLTRVRQLVHTSHDGTSLRAICRAAAELGLEARAVKASRRTLDELPMPAVAHMDGNHWVVLYDVSPERVRIADPAFGHRRMDRSTFEARWSGYAAVFDYVQDFKAVAADQPRRSAWLWGLLRPYKAILLQALGLALVVAGLQMVLPIFTQVVVDRVLVEREFGLLRTIVIGMLVVFLFMSLAILVQRYLLSFAAVRIDSSSLDFLTRKLLALPLSYFYSRRTGDIQRRLGGMRQIRQFLVENVVSGLMAAVQLLAAITVMMVYSIVLTAMFLIVVPLYVLLMYASMRWLKPIFGELEEGFSKYQSHQIDAIRGIETVKAMGAEGPLRELMLTQFHGIARRQFKADFAGMCYDGAVQTVTFLATALFLWVGAYQVMSGGLTVGGFVAFNALVALASAPLAILLSLWDNLQLSSVLLERVSDILEHPPEQNGERERLVPVRTLEGRISLRNVGFRYGGVESPAILEGIDLEVLPGQRVAIVGRSGSGKTTLVKCLAGLLEPTEGTILFDGLDLKTLNYRDLRRHIGWVLQQSHLFDTTIGRNIAFGEDEPDMDRVLWAARVANAHQFIERLPLGYDTRVGETGIALSGGQRQMIAIARALYHQPAVLIFDEATSSLDTESERAITENLGRLLEGRTAFVIAHRLSTVRDADVIIVLDQGRLVESGTHDDLLDRQGLYYFLCGQQLELLT